MEDGLALNASDFSKQDIRKAALEKRDAMDEATRIEAGLKLVDYADDLDISAGSIVSGFFPIRSEIDVRPLMSALGASGARLCLPVVIDKETIEFRHLERGAGLVETGFGTFGPGENADVLDPEILLVPLAAFDDDGNRVGYGAGFYDRAIARLHSRGLFPRLIGVGFECQHFEQIPAQAHDVPLHFMLTENGLYEFKRTIRT